MTSLPQDRRIMLAEAALRALRAHRDHVLVEFSDGQTVRLEKLIWSHDEGEDFAEVIGNVGDALTAPEALRFFTNEVVGVTDPKTGREVFRLPSDLEG